MSIRIWPTVSLALTALILTGCARSAPDSNEVRDTRTLVHAAQGLSECVATERRMLRSENTASAALRRSREVERTMERSMQALMQANRRLQAALLGAQKQEKTAVDAANYWERKASVKQSA